MEEGRSSLDEGDVGLVRRDVSVLSLARWLAVAALFTWTQTFAAYRPFEAIDNILNWLAHRQAADAIPVFNITSLALHVLSVFVWGAVLREVAKVVSTRRHARREGLPSRADVADVEVTTDADFGFACSMHMKSGGRVRVPARTEARAREIARELAPSAGEDVLVFEGVGDGRRRETLNAALALAGVAGVFALISTLDAALRFPIQATPYSFAYWLDWLNTFDVAFLGPLAALAAKPIARRLASGRVAVGAREIVIGEGRHARRIARASIARAVAGEGSEVVIALDGGESVRVSFASDRPIVERELLLARLAPSDAPAVTSGVRVRAEGASDDDAVEAITPLAREGPRATR